MVSHARRDGEVIEMDLVWLVGWLVGLASRGFTQQTLGTCRTFPGSPGAFRPEDVVSPGGEYYGCRGFGGKWVPDRPRHSFDTSNWVGPYACTAINNKYTS